MWIKMHHNRFIWPAAGLVLGLKFFFSSSQFLNHSQNYKWNATITIRFRKSKCFIDGYIEFLFVYWFGNLGQSLISIYTIFNWNSKTNIYIHWCVIGLKSKRIETNLCVCELTLFLRTQWSNCLDRSGHTI